MAFRVALDPERSHLETLITAAKTLQSSQYSYIVKFPGDMDLGNSIQPTAPSFQQPHKGGLRIPRRRGRCHLSCHPPHPGQAGTRGRARAGCLVQSALPSPSGALCAVPSLGPGGMLGGWVGLERGGGAQLPYIRLATFPRWACWPTCRMGPRTERKETLTVHMPSSGHISTIYENAKSSRKRKTDSATEKWEGETPEGKRDRRHTRTNRTIYVT